MTRTIRWLHISDFHFQHESYDRDVVTQAFVASLPNLIARHGKIDLIFATGDIANFGRAAEYETATAFFNQILAATHVPKNHLFVIPGNHDIDRKKGKGLARTIRTGEEANEYFDPTDPLPHLETRQSAFGAWFDSYFQGIRSFPLNTSCALPERVSIDGRVIEILAANTAIFCIDDNDHAKLWLGKRSVDAAIAASASADLKIALLHHPFDWLASGEATVVRTAIRDYADVILTGHLHENNVDLISGVSEATLHLAAGALYQTTKWPNTAMICELTGDTLKITPLQYVGSPRPLWTIDPSLFTHTNDYSQSFPIERLRTEAIGVSSSDAPRALTVVKNASARADFEKDLFVTPNQKLLYVEPRLMTRPQEFNSSSKERAERVTLADLVNRESSCIIETRQEYGSTTLARRLAYEFELVSKACIRKDARELPNYRKKLETAIFPDKAAVGGAMTLVLDRFDVEKDEKLLKEIIGAGWFNRIIAIVADHGPQAGSMPDVNDYAGGFEHLYLWAMGRDEIRSLAVTLFDTSDQVFITRIVDKVYSDLLALCIPLTPSNVVMYLKVLFREGEFNPLNRVDILGRYISEILRRPGDVYTDSFNVKNKLDVISAFVHDMYSKASKSFDDRSWHEFMKRYQEDTEFDGVQLLQDLLDSRVIVRVSGRLFLKYSFFFLFFLGRYITARPALMQDFLEHKKYLDVPGIVDVITGLSSDNTAFIIALTKELTGVLHEFSETYIKQDFDPLKGAVWPDNADEEKLWASVSADLEAGPRSIDSIDTIKTSALAEARTSDQEVRYSALRQLEVTLFHLATVLSDALKNADDVRGNLKLAAYEAILRSENVGFQIGCICAPILAKKSYFRWGGVAFFDFDQASKSSEPAEAITNVIISLSECIAIQSAELIGSQKLAGVFKAREKHGKQINFLDVINFNCILNARGQDWFPTLEQMIRKSDKNSFYLSTMLTSLMNFLQNEVATSKDRESAKRLVALIQAKRTFSKQAPGEKAVNKILQIMEKEDRFAS